MKTCIVVWVMWMAWMVGTGSALAAPQITVTITKSFGADVTGPANCKTTSGRDLIFPFSETSEGDDASLLSKLLAEGATCGAERADVTIELPKQSTYPLPVLPREYQWSYPSRRWIDRAISKLGPPDSCDAAEKGQEPANNGKNCKASRNTNGIAFDLTSPFDNGEIIATYKPEQGNGNAEKKIRIPVHPCEFDVKGPLPGIVAGASEQVLYLVVSGKTPSCRLLRSAGTLHDAARTHSIFAQVEEADSLGLALRLTDVPSGLSGDIQEFTLQMAGGINAVVRAHVIPAAVVSKLVVKYQVPEELDAYGHFASASGDAGISDSGDRFAVVSRRLKVTEKEKEVEVEAVVNTALLSWSSTLASLSADKSVREAHQNSVAKLTALAKQIKVKEDRVEQLRAQLSALAPTPSAPPRSPVPDPNAKAKETIAADLTTAGADLTELLLLQGELNKEVHKEQSYFLWRIRPEEGAVKPEEGAVKLEEGAVKPEEGAVKPEEGDVKPEEGAVKPEEGDVKILQTDKDDEFTGDLRRISFVVRHAMSTPLNAVLALEQTVKPKDKVEYLPPRSVLKLIVPLATKARVESLPLPARDLMEVVCNDETVAFWNGEIHAIRETAVTEGECRVQLKPADAVKDKNAKKWRKLHDLLPLYGSQTFSVVVRRGGVESKQLWQFSSTANSTYATPTAGGPTRQPFWAKSLNLEEPRSETKTDAYYTVEVRPIANQNIAVEYRNNTLPKIAEATIAAAGELTFTTRLRSRGVFAIPCAKPYCGKREDGVYKKPSTVRTYISASVIASGLRFPAATVDLKSSTSTESVQYLTPLVGVLWSWERWDYDRGIDPWPLNPVIQVGGHFYDTSKNDIGFNPLFGVAVTLPLVQEETPIGSQLGTKATLGVFGEVDTQDASIHALLALSINIGSLLSGK